ncbi:lysosome membrane protein 2-like [Lineus longissimus]|uniref:lysosome membrane protein 2-like n=1 Tax=Lineus longissimus TaxID=88925 RepID=UPI002B4CC5BF
MQDRSLKIIFGIGVVGLLIGCAMIPILKVVIHEEVLKNVYLTDSPGGPSEAYKMWMKPTVPIYMQFYVFDVVNPAEVLTGEKPFLVQKGPYTYRESREKVNITHNGNGTVSYEEIKTYNFVREMSVGDDSDNFTTVNIPLLTLVEALRFETKVFQDLVSTVLKLFNEDVFVKLSVNDIIWGYHDDLLALGHDAFPDWIYTSFIGVFSNKNHTADGVYTIYTGETDTLKLGVIDKFNGSSHLNFWSDKYANMVNGSDGTLGPPFTQKSWIVYTFVSDICRSVPGTFDAEETTAQGIQLYRFTGPEWALAGVEENPDNKGFCTPAGNCMGNGVVNITSCQLIDFFHIPTVVSLPHFLMADKKYRDAVYGMHPDPVEHRTEIGIEPMTGLSLKVAKRLQINIFVQYSEFVSQTHNISDTVFPLFWLNESAVIDDATADMLKGMLFTPLLVGHVIMYLLIGSGGYVVVVGIVYFFLRINRSAKRKRVAKPDIQPLHQNGTASPHVQGEPNETTRLISNITYETTIKNSPVRYSDLQSDTE